MMATELKAWAGILKQPIQHRRSMGGLGSVGMTGGLLLIALAAIVGGAAMQPSRGRALVVAFGAGVPLAMLCLMWWVYLLRSIAEQCRPVAGRLVPRLRERARNVTVAAWGAIVLLMVLIIGLPLQHPWHVAAIAGLALLHLHGVFFIYMVIFASNPWLPIAGWLGPIWNSDVAAVAGLAVAAFALRRFVRGMFGASPHLGNIAQTPSLAAMIGPNVARLARMARFSGPESRDQHDDRPLFMRVLGSQGHSVPRFELTVLTLVCAVMAGLNAYRGGEAHANLHFVRAAIVIVLLCVQLVVASNMLTSFAARKEEQGLVRLAAGAPDAAQMNRMLARHFVVRLAKMWLAYSALSMAALLVLGATPDEALRALAVCAFGLPLMGLPLADHARAVKAVSPIVRVLTVVAALCAFLAVWGKGSLVLWGIVALATVCAAAAFVAVRWTRMVRAAPAFPARRI